MAGASRIRSMWMVATIIACFAWGMLAAGPAGAAEPPQFVASFGPDGTEATGFGRAGSVAVDEGADEGAGAVYVIDHDEGSLLKFDIDGNPLAFEGSAPYISGNEITGLALGSRVEETQVAVDPNSHDFYVVEDNSIRAFHPSGEPSEFTAGPGAGSSSIGGFGEAIGVAVDVNGAIYAADYDSGVEVFSHSGGAITQFAAPSAANLAVDTKGNVYVGTWTSAVHRYSPSVFPVSGSTSYSKQDGQVDPSGALGLTVDPTTNDVYITRNSSSPGVVRYNEFGELLSAFGRAGEEGELHLSEGIAVHGGERRIFVSDDPGVGLSQVKIFEEGYVGPPRIESVAVSAVTADTARFHARINPGSAPTTYRFEYGLSDCSSGGCASVPLEGGDAGSGGEATSVSQPVTGLQVATTYHYRVIAENEFGTGEYEVGAMGDHIFTTQTGVLGFRLSDFRAWEMVSPPDKHGGRLLSSNLGLIQGAADGNALAYISNGPTVTDTEGNRAPEPSTALARRGASGWTSESIMPPNERVTRTPAGYGGEYKLFSPELSRALLQPLSGTPLSPAASERTPYLRANTNPPVYTPLVSGKEGFANVPPGTEFGGGALAPTVTVAGASRGLDHVGLRSSVSLGAGDPPTSSYVWSSGQLRPINVLPASEGGGRITPAELGSGVGSVLNAISEDGSRAFWGAGGYSSTGNRPTALYLRDLAAGATVRLDDPAPGATGEAAPVFQGANPAGTVVFFTDSRQMTADASPSGVDLYRCEIQVGPLSSGCSTLIDVSAPKGSGESSEVQGLISGMSEDGNAVYFVALGVLDAGPNSAGESATPAMPNLYAWTDTGGTRFVATLSFEDSSNWGAGAATAQMSSAAASPSGRYLAFMSERNLTGYDSRDPVSGEPAQEVYRYDVVTDVLECVSCNPTGAAPESALRLPEEVPLIDPQRQWGGRRLAAVLPQPTALSLSGPSLYRPRGVLDNGRVFFNAFDALVSADSNGEWDVYQYESMGIGDCSAASDDAGTASSGGGCVSLMSSGTAEEEAAFLDAGAAGDDVFFLTSARLAVTDEDEELDIYDARVGGAAPVRPPAAVCQGESCREIEVPPGAAVPGSASFSGPGNLHTQRRRCARGKRKIRRGGKSRCVVRKQRKHSRHGRQRGGHRHVEQANADRGLDR